MKKKIVLKESQLIDMIEKIVKRTQAQQLKEAEAKGVQSNAMGKKKGDKKAEPFVKSKEGGAKDGNGLNKVGNSIPSSVSVKKGPAGGSKPNNSERGAPAPKKGKIAKEDPTPKAPFAMKKVGQPKGRV
jgi:hypothetical protein